MDNADDRWWEQVDLTKLILASNALDHLSEDIQLLPALVALDVCILIIVFLFLVYRVVSLFHTLTIHSHADNKDATSQIWMSVTSGYHKYGMHTAKQFPLSCTSVDSRLAAYGMLYMFVFVSKYILKTLHEMKWNFLLVPAYPGCPGQTAVKWLLLLLLLSAWNECHNSVKIDLKSVFIKTVWPQHIFYYTVWVKKTRHQTHAYNFPKC